MSLTHSSDIPAPVADDVGPDAPHGVHAVPRRPLLWRGLRAVDCLHGDYRLCVEDRSGGCEYLGMPLAGDRR